ncbi:hypothetical protein TorRG33x02_102580 [Trema orientale]|uniref:Retroviral polymerase SH3-like domain-containing protein n=1 Tax=Trema orientale TaxID=63057 RepID=A0A2P5F7U1_TREOI|nr:hypothetical protein TorRG33x02_102580 [Trema orientale]
MKTPITCLQFHASNTNLFNSLPLKIFGCVAYVHLPPRERSKLDPRALKCIFLGYSSNKKAFKCFHPPTQKYYVTMDVKFFENLVYYPTADLQGEIRDREDLMYVNLVFFQKLNTEKKSRDSSSRATNSSRRNRHRSCPTKESSGLLKKKINKRYTTCLSLSRQIFNSGVGN